MPGSMPMPCKMQKDVRIRPRISRRPFPAGPLDWFPFRHLAGRVCVLRGVVFPPPPHLAVVQLGGGMVANKDLG